MRDGEKLRRQRHKIELFSILLQKIIFQSADYKLLKIAKKESKKRISN